MRGRQSLGRGHRILPHRPTRAPGLPPRIAGFGDFGSVSACEGAMKTTALFLIALLVVPQATASPPLMATNWFSATWNKAKQIGSAAWTTVKVAGTVIGLQMEQATKNTVNTVRNVVAPPQAPAPPQPPDVVCAQQGLAWDGQSCVRIQAIDDLPSMDCQQNQYWDGTQCRTIPTPSPKPAAPTASQPCQSGQYYDSVHGECWKTKLDFDMQTCADAGKFWYENACRTEDQVAQAACQGQGGQLNADDRLCYQRDDVAAVCQNQGALWVESQQRCYVGGAGDIPRGLEKFYFLVKTPQEKALYGAYRDALTKNLYDQEAAVRDAIEEI